MSDNYIKKPSMLSVFIGTPVLVGHAVVYFSFNSLNCVYNISNNFINICSYFIPSNYSEQENNSLHNEDPSSSISPDKKVEYERIPCEPYNDNMMLSSILTGVPETAANITHTIGYISHKMFIGDNNFNQSI